MQSSQKGTKTKSILFITRRLLKSKTPKHKKKKQAFYPQDYNFPFYKHRKKIRPFSEKKTTHQKKQESYNLYYIISWQYTEITELTQPLETTIPQITRNEEAISSVLKPIFSFSELSLNKNENFREKKEKNIP